MDQVSQIRDKIDIVSFITEFIPLKKAGRNFKANCPFHGEKTPSFVVSSERQIWHCFGCQKGGDVYTFLMEYEHMDFGEALRTLAKKTGVELVNSHFDSQASSQKETIYKINFLASEFYHYVLTKHNAGKKALAYLEGRKIRHEVMNTFKIGFAPYLGNALSKYLTSKKNYKAKDLVDAGLAFEKGRDLVDFFKGRIIFPLYDHRDNIAGFSGRVLEEGAAQSKYINTRDTLVYHKGETFFGIQIAKQNIKKENQAILVEGEFDVISSFQEGISNVLAIKGTALTENQVRLLTRYSSKATICFDGDKAGQEALKRSLPILEKKGLATTVVVIPNGKDPDESIKNDSYAFKKAVKEDVSVYDYLFDQAIKTYDAKTAEGKKKITDELLSVYAAIENEVVKEHYFRKLSAQLDTSLESILKELERRKEKKQTDFQKFLPTQKRTREEILEEYVLALILQSESPKKIYEVITHVISDVLLGARAHQKVIIHMQSYFQTQDAFDGKIFAGILPQELMSAYDTAFVFPLPKFEKAEQIVLEAEKAAMELRHLYLRSKIKLLGEEIREKEKEGDEESLQKLQEELTTLVSRLQTPS